MKMYNKATKEALFVSWTVVTSFAAAIFIQGGIIMSSFWEDMWLSTTLIAVGIFIVLASVNKIVTSEIRSSKEGNQ